MSITVSICIPAYNNAASLKRLLDSVRQQTYTDYELILTDDSTDDNVERLVHAFPDLPIHYRKNKTGLGPTANTNEAVRMACGQYIKVMHHDDAFACPESLEKLVALLDSDQRACLAFCGTNENVYDERGQVVKDKSYTRAISETERWQLDTDYRNLFLVNMIGAPSAVIYRNQGKLFDENLKWLVDVEFYLRLLQDNFNYADTSEPLINIGISDTQVTRSCLLDQELILREYQYVFEKYHLSTSRLYRKHLIRMVIQMNRNYSELKKYGIGYREYFDQRLRLMIKRLAGGKQ